MRKLFYFVIAIAAMGIMASCGGGTSTPGAAAKKYFEAMAAGNYDKFMDGMYIDPESTPDELQEIAQQKKMFVAMIEEKGEDQNAEKGGIKKIDVVSEEIAEDGKSATVTMLVTYGNGETNEDDVQMLYDGSSWKWSMGK